MYPVQTANFNGNTYRAGKYVGKMNGVDFEAWCVDISQVIYFNTDYVYELEDAPDTNMTDLMQAIGKFDLDGGVTSPSISANTQLDIWKTIAGQATGGTYPPSEGARVLYLRNDAYQDLVTFSTVPEPMPLLLMGIALLGVGVVSRKQ